MTLMSKYKGSLLGLQSKSPQIQTRGWGESVRLPDSLSWQKNLLSRLKLLPSISDVARYFELCLSGQPGVQCSQALLSEFVCGPRPSLNMYLGQVTHMVFHDAINYARQLLMISQRPSLHEVIANVIGRAQQAVDSAVSDAIKKAKEEGLANADQLKQYEKKLISLYDQVAIEVYTELRDTRAATVWLTEQQLDASHLGLWRDARADLTIDDVVAELKTVSSGFGSPRTSSRSHRVQVAGYVLALEGMTHRPRDNGMVILVDLGGQDPDPVIALELFHVDEDLRMDFLRARDGLIKNLADLVNSYSVRNYSSLQALKGNLCAAASNQGQGGQLGQGAGP